MAKRRGLREPQELSMDSMIAGIRYSVKVGRRGKSIFQSLQEGGNRGQFSFLPCLLHDVGLQFLVLRRKA